MKILIVLLKTLLRLISFFKGEKYRYSQEYEDNFRTMDLQEKLWWAYKALVRQIEKAEKGKNIEEHFAAQKLEFGEDDAFQPQSTVVVTAGGDLSCSEVISAGSLEHVWDEVRDFYFDADIVCANLEAPLDSSKPAGMVPAVCLTAPDLNTAPEIFERFIDGGRGVNFFSTANNHSLDQGEAGIAATLDFLDSNGYAHVGTSRTPEEQRDIPVIEKNGIRIAFIAYTYCLNGYEPIPGKEYMTNVVRLNKPDSDISLIKEHIKAAHGKKADIIIAVLHWSVEFETYPLENIIKMGHKIMDCGVDIILGGHPHVVQPMEKYRFHDPFSGHEKDGFIIYSLGELVSYNAFSRNSRLAVLVKLELTKGLRNGTACTEITGLKVLPIYTLIRKLKNKSYDYRLLDLARQLTLLDNGENPYGFSTKEIKELKRLERLLKEKLLPAENSALIYNTNIERFELCQSV